MLTILIMIVVGIPLTIVAWNRGWKWRAILPVCIGLPTLIILGFVIGFILGAMGASQRTIDNAINIITIVEYCLDAVILGILIYMVAKRREEEKPIIFNAPGASPNIPVYTPPAVTPAAPVYIPPAPAPAAPPPTPAAAAPPPPAATAAPPPPAAAQPSILAAKVQPATPYEPATTPAPVNIAKLVLPDNRESIIRGTDKTLGRHDFDNIVSPEELKFISREHIVIKTDGSRYYVEDKGSSNGTKVNDVSITGKGRWELKDGDRIKLADVVTLQFKLSSAF
ncbi:MAG: FHA domain-containing protein [Dehalococcoidales bacterium]